MRPCSSWVFWTAYHRLNAQVDSTDFLAVLNKSGFLGREASGNDLGQFNSSLCGCRHPVPLLAED